MIVFFPHSTTSNHGCEAILLSIGSMLKDGAKIHSPLALIHRDVKHDNYESLKKYYSILSYPKVEIKRGSIKWVRAQINSILYRNKEINHYLDFKRFMKKNTDTEAYISIGGDNYCYGVPYFMYAVDKYANDSHAKLILWGCSIENNCDDKKLKDLSRFDLIIARETLTYQYLKSKLNNRIICLPDPAFTLKKEESEDFRIPENTVGVNISPLVLDYEANSGKTYENYKNLLSYILTKTTLNVALIPHVTVQTTDDREPLKKLYEEYLLYRDRMYMVPEGNCQQLKYAISQCRFFIGARTHSTIAAYSSGVPTIVVGYSIKSRGIARDLFGQEEHYVVHVQSLSDGDALIKEFNWLMSNEETIRRGYKETMPEYIYKASLASVEVIKEIESSEEDAQRK